MRLRLVLTFALLVGNATAAAEPQAEVVEVQVAFSVVNRNTSLVPCAADGRPYVVRGVMLMPTGRPPEAITLWLHGASAGTFMWHFTAVPGYSFATALAERGHASLVIDRLGYDSSDHPEGMDTCVGSQADVIHQIVGQLRAGSYQGGGGAAFARVALGSHSSAAPIIEAEAYSWHDVDALVPASWVDPPGYGAVRIYEAGVNIFATCGRGGDPVEDDGSGPGGYTYAWPTAEQAGEDVFYNVDPAVGAAFFADLNRDPCGYYTSLGQAMILNNVLLMTIDVPVLLVFGDHDLVLPVETEVQAARFAGSDDVTVRFLPEAGHTFQLSRTAAAGWNVVGNWLAARNL